MVEYVLIIYPLGFREDKVLPKALGIGKFKDIDEAKSWAAIYTLNTFNSPEEFEGCHVVELA